MSQANTKSIKKRRRLWSADDTELTLLSLPTVVWYIIFSYLPMFGLIIAFKNYKLVPGKGFVYSLLKSEFVGFDNFKFFVENKTFGLLLRNTIGYNIIFIILGLIVPVTLAILISQLYSKRASKVYQTLMFFPFFLSWVVVSYFVFAFLNPGKGMANQILALFGADPVKWYGTAKPWPFIFVFMNLWKGTGYNMVVYLASITGMDETMYEAAMLDGASKWQQAKYITLPQLKPIIIIMFILSVGRIFYSDFGLFWQVTREIPRALYNVSSTFDTFLFVSLRDGTSIGRTAAPGLLQSAACAVTILITNAIVKKIDPESGII